MTDALRPALSLVTFAIALTALCATAAAQDPLAPSHETLAEEAAPLAISRAARSVRADATSIALNPGMLALVELPELDYIAVGSDAFASGHGLYGVVPLFGFVGLGAGVDFLSDELDQTPFRRYRLGLGLAIPDLIGLGLAYNFFGSERSLDIDQLDSLSLGLTTRLIPALALSVVVDHLNTPRFDGRWLEPVWHFGAGSALLDGRLKLDATVTWSEHQEEIIDGMISVTPIDGLDLFVDGKVDLDGFGRWGGGAALDFGFGGVHLAAYALSTDQEPVGFDGVTGGITLRTQPVASLISPRQRWVRLSVPATASERAPRTPFGVAGISFAGLLLQLDRLADDPSVDGVVLEIAGLGYGFAQLWELRQVVERMRDNGITVVAHLDDTSTRSYYLASAADRVYMSPGQGFSAAGLSVTLTFYRGLFDLLGVDPEFVRIDEYKTAPEAYTASGPSEPQLEQMNDYLDAIFDTMVDAIAASRGLHPGQVRALIDDMPLRAREAVAAGLVDGLEYREELGVRIADDLGLRAPLALEEDAGPLRRREEAWTHTPTIAVIYIDGNIAKGPSIEVPLLGSITTGSSTINAMLDWARRSPQVRGVVLRVDSPGGSAHASELMYHAIEKLAAEKPVVVSMGNVAASGGYYVAAPGDHVMATPMTLTGSIGVFAGKFSLGGLLRRIGIRQFVLRRGQAADLYSTARPWSEDDRARILDDITGLYELFIERVATGRGLDPSVVRTAAEGRVWTGEAALARGLVDEVGGFLAALDAVKLRSGLAADDRVALVHLPPRSPLSAFEVGLPIGIIRALSDVPDDVPDLELEAPQLPALELDLLEALVGEAVGAASLPTAVFLDPGEALMVLPFDWTVTP